jgi:hypothetical protein
VQLKQRNRLENRLRKALSVASRLSIEEAREAVFRGPRAGSNPLPIEVFASFARAAGFLVQNGRVESPQELDPAVELSGSELHLFAALSAIGGIGSYQEVRSLCLEQGMNLHTCSGYMSRSPIVKRVAPETWALVGAETEPPGRVRETSRKLTGHAAKGARAHRVHGPDATRVARSDRSSRAVRRSDSTKSYARGRAFHSHGRTPEGAVWIAFNATDGLRRTGLFALPKVVRDQLDEDAYTVSGPDGEEIGELENRQSAPSSAIARYLKGKTLAQREIVLLEFDLLAAEARLTITSEGQLPEHVAKLDGRFLPAQDRPE